MKLLYIIIFIIFFIKISYSQDYNFTSNKKTILDNEDNIKSETSEFKMIFFSCRGGFLTIKDANYQSSSLIIINCEQKIVNDKTVWVYYFKEYYGDYTYIYAYISNDLSKVYLVWSNNYKTVFDVKLIK